MKKLIIVDKTAALNGGAAKPSDLSGMVDGSIGFYELADDTAWLAAAPTKDFAIVAGRGKAMQAIVIPEVDMKTVKVVKAEYAAGTPLKKEFTIVLPSDDAGVKINGRIYFDYTVIVSKAGVNINERSNYTFTERLPKTIVAKDVATKIANSFKLQFANSGIDVDVTNTNEKVTFTAKTPDVGFNVILADAISNLAVTTTDTVASSGTPAQIEELAKACAADAGYEYTDETEIYKGYPGKVDSSAKYILYTLSYETVKHPSAHTSEETVNQVVHIAVPTGATSAATLDTILTLV